MGCEMFLMCVSQGTWEISLKLAEGDSPHWPPPWSPLVAFSEFCWNWASGGKVSQDSSHHSLDEGSHTAHHPPSWLWPTHIGIQKVLISNPYGYWCFLKLSILLAAYVIHISYCILLQHVPRGGKTDKPTINPQKAIKTNQLNLLVHVYLTSLDN